MKRGLFLLVVCLFSAATAAADTYVLDRGHSSATFNVRHLIGRFTGKFDDFTMSLNGDPSDAAKASVEFTIKAASIDTGNAMRDDHLRSGDFFDAAKFPEITFHSTSIRPARRKNVFDVTGDLTMHGVTHRVTLPVEYLGTMKDGRGREVAGFAISTTLNRKDYGIVWNEALDGGGAVLGDDVDVIVSLEMVKKASPK
jgi:polyisoprenoid-binding protein YceI